MCYTCDRRGTSKVIFGYNGRDGVITDDNGLIYMRARYYSPEMKRFINADIVAGEISNAVTLNRFAYANGNPVSFVDPFGLSAERGAWNSSTSWFENNILDPIVKFGEEFLMGIFKFFDPDSLELYGDFEEDWCFGSGRLSLGDSTVGASAKAGLINEEEGTEIDAKADAKAGLYGVGFDLGILLPI